MKHFILRLFAASFLIINSVFGGTQIDLATQVKGTLDSSHLSGGGSSSTGLPIGWVDVMADYGAACNGSTNDDAAFANAIASGKNVYIPGGTTTSPKVCKLSATLTPLAGQTIHADSWYTVYISFTGTTNFLFHLTNSNVSIDGVRVVQSGKPTAGGHFRLGNHSRRIYSTKLTNIRSQGAYIGIDLYGMIDLVPFDRVDVNSSLFAGIQVDLPPPSGALQWDAVTIEYVPIGLYVRQCDTSHISNLHLSSAGTALWLRGDHGSVSQLRITELSNEDSSGDMIIGDGGYPVSFNSITQLEAYNDGPKTLTLGAYATDNTISNANLDGYRYVDNGERNKLVNSLIHSRRAPSTIEEENRDTIYYSGVTLNGSDAVLSGVHVIDFPIGVTMSANGTYAILTGNNTRGLSTPYNLNPTAKATGRGVGNIGIADW